MLRIYIINRRCLGPWDLSCRAEDMSSMWIPKSGYDVRKELL